MARMEQWSLVQGEINPYQPPETFTQHLCGQVYGREGFVEGDHVTTSAVVGVKIEGDKTFVDTKSGHVYELGAVDPAYEAAYPGALERLRKSVVKDLAITGGLVWGAIINQSPLPDRPTEVRIMSRYLLDQLKASAKTLESLIMRVPSGEARNALTEINISNMMAQEVLKNLIAKGVNHG